MSEESTELDLLSDDPAADRGNIPLYGVRDVSVAIKAALEGHFGQVRISGEIAGFRGVHASGNCYFSLRQDNHKLDAVIWKWSFGKLSFRPEEGAEVIATGKIGAYSGSSRYQIVVEDLKPAGRGALMAMLDERKRKLEAEGLFAATSKQELPTFPKRTVVVTAVGGAALQDIMATSLGRLAGQIYLVPVAVQGKDSPRQITEALRKLGSMAASDPRRPELIIIARGGGGLEDLWGFNDEELARAAFACPIPVVSAVGHEVDWTILDYVADLRAPTPTAAAEMVWPSRRHYEEKTATIGAYLIRRSVDLVDRASHRLHSVRDAAVSLQTGLSARNQRIDVLSGRSQSLIERRLIDGRAELGARREELSYLNPVVRLSAARSRFRYLLSELNRVGARFPESERQDFAALSAALAAAHPSDEIKRLRQNLADSHSALQRAVAVVVEERRRQVEGMGSSLRLLGPDAVLNRGYAIVFDNDAQPVKTLADARSHSLFNIKFADGSLDVERKGQRGPRRPKHQPTTDPDLFSGD